MNTKIQVVSDILKRLNAVQKDDIQNVPKHQLHYLRNDFRRLIGDRYDDPELLADIGEDDPDDALMVIIRDVWQALTDPPESKNLPFDQWGVLPQGSSNTDEAEQLFGNILEKSQLPVYLLLPALLKMRKDHQGDEERFMEHLRALSQEYGEE